MDTIGPVGQVRLHIGNQDIAEASGGVYEHLDPVSGAVQARIPLAGAAEMERAVQAAAETFEGWRRTKPQVRRDMGSAQPWPDVSFRDLRMRALLG